jgi:3-deoxy-D-manno-octulosonate 8-phosphate phosphatase (KDO 8-P phosphatase)
VRRALCVVCKFTQYASRNTIYEMKVNLADIEVLVIDVDGVLTDGTVVINADGSESKFFSVLDGHGIRLWRRAGLKVAFLSGRHSQPTEYRAKQLEVEYVFQDCHNKLDALKKFLEQEGLSADRIAYIGDDLPDLPPIRYVGFGVAVANAVDEVKQYADYVTTRSGGSGAVREVIEYILKNTGKWQKLMERYLSDEPSSVAQRRLDGQDLT